MKNYQHILVPIDFSASSDNTIRQAIGMQQSHHCKLTVVNYVEPLPATCYGDVVSEIEEGMEKNARLHMQEFSNRHQLPSENVRIEMGHAKAGIPLIAQQLGADLIVIGSHGHHSRLGDLLLGSTTSRVVYHSPCDVYVVHK